MSKIKNYIMNSVEKQVDKITNEYVEGHIDLNTAENKISEVDNVELVVDKHNIDEHLYFAKHDKEQKTLSKYY